MFGLCVWAGPTTFRFKPFNICSRVYARQSDSRALEIKPVPPSLLLCDLPFRPPLVYFRRGPSFLRGTGNKKQNETKKQTPAFQSHQAFLKAVDFDESEAAKVVDASAECFRAARTLASDLLRRGDSAAKASAAAAAAAATATAALAGGSANGTLPPFAPSAAEGGLAAGGVGDPAGEAWATDRLELLAMAKLAVSNGVAAMQVVKHSSTAAAAAAKGGGKAKGGAKLDFGSHSQFPAVKATFA